MAKKIIEKNITKINFELNYFIDCANCSYYQVVEKRPLKCPNCKNSLHLKKILY